VLKARPTGSRHVCSPRRPGRHRHPADHAVSWAQLAGSAWTPAGQVRSRCWRIYSPRSAVRRACSSSNAGGAGPGMTALRPAGRPATRGAQPQTESLPAGRARAESTRRAARRKAAGRPRGRCRSRRAAWRSARRRASRPWPRWPSKPSAPTDQRSGDPDAAQANPGRDRYSQTRPPAVHRCRRTHRHAGRSATRGPPTGRAGHGDGRPTQAAAAAPRTVRGDQRSQLPGQRAPRLDPVRQPAVLTRTPSRSGGAAPPPRRTRPRSARHRRACLGKDGQRVAVGSSTRATVRVRSATAASTAHRRAPARGLAGAAVGRTAARSGAQLMSSPAVRRLLTGGTAQPGRSEIVPGRAGCPRATGSPDVPRDAGAFLGTPVSCRRRGHHRATSPGQKPGVLQVASLTHHQGLDEW
jgi:hypothetical protein